MPTLCGVPVSITVSGRSIVLPRQGRCGQTGGRSEVVSVHFAGKLEFDNCMDHIEAWFEQRFGAGRPVTETGRPVEAFAIRPALCAKTPFWPSRFPGTVIQVRAIARFNK